ncbi:hypothetical protein KVV02_002013 [Mortierella alpina]|uniref:RlpA-like protein double-psi beta-barrel domain-containing protein n=1 Tax=Mortierella alpina TaxID=64518 RepID=A0A9P8A4I9_MORAP|nr:hypothetical protein KVV02_002013 [Mortierella alpina]
MTRFISLAILAASLLSVIASPLTATPKSTDITPNTPSSDDLSIDGPTFAFAEIADPSPAAVGWESLEEQPEVAIDHVRLEKRAPRRSKDKKKSKKNDKKKGKKGETRPDNRAGGKTFHGRGTWFSDTHGSCGVKFSQSDLIVALNEEQMGSSGRSARCGQRIRVTAKGSKASVILRVVDTCPKKYCKFGGLDISKAAFRKFAPESKGVLDLSWSFV